MIIKLIKTCSVCNKIKAITDFNTRPDRSNGYRSECKKCQYKRHYKKQKERNPKAQKAYLKVFYAKKASVLVATDLCEMCGENPPIHAHHEDYDLPLEVKWVCTKCHAKIHKTKNYIA